MLKYRLIFGTLMTLCVVGLVVLDGWLDGTLSRTTSDDNAVKGTIFCVLTAVVVIAAQLELSHLAGLKNLKVFLPLTIPGAVLFGTSWYWPQFGGFSRADYVLCLTIVMFFGFLLYQYTCCGTEGVIANCGANVFCVIYLGLLGSFLGLIRIEFGLWALLMVVFVVKCADIGAYAIGSMFGRHKFSPGISPGKTWEGMGGAAAAAVIVAIAFAEVFDIMAWWLAVIFGVCFAFFGQLGDLAESMLKRDAERKDSANSVPGFGGILDVVDSLLVSAPLCYVFFRAACSSNFCRF